MRPGSLNKGASLIEVIVYSSVLLLLLGTIYVVVEGGMRDLRLADTGQTVNQQAVIGLRKVIHELGPASQLSLEVNPPAGGDYATFLSPRAPESSPSGYTFVGPNLEWKKWVSLFLDGDQLVKAEDELPSFVTDPLSVPIPNYLTDVSTWTPRRPLAEKVSFVRFSRLNPSVVRIELTTAVATGTNKTSELELISSVRLMNR